jgi:hypothetical protein
LVAEKTWKSRLVTSLVAFVVPPAIAGKLWEEFVTHHPVWAVAISALGEQISVTSR